LSFSYGRALQEPALQAWRGQAAQVRSAQAALLARARANGAACMGRYEPGLEASEVAQPSG
jgi:fructose-bisphosphate aldolase class I